MCANNTGSGAERTAPLHDSDLRVVLSDFATILCMISNEKHVCVFLSCSTTASYRASMISLITASSDSMFPQTPTLRKERCDLFLRKTRCSRQEMKGHHGEHASPFNQAGTVMG
jgi:hypothetical protein